jgi:hypothetical protein
MEQKLLTLTRGGLAIIARSQQKPYYQAIVEIAWEGLKDNRRKSWQVQKICKEGRKSLN